MCWQIVPDFAYYFLSGQPSYTSRLLPYCEGGFIAIISCRPPSVQAEARAGLLCEQVTHHLRNHSPLAQQGSLVHSIKGQVKHTSEQTLHESGSRQVVHQCATALNEGSDTNVP